MPGKLLRLIVAEQSATSAAGGSDGDGECITTAVLGEGCMANATRGMRDCMLFAEFRLLFWISSSGPNQGKVSIRRSEPNFPAAHDRHNIESHPRDERHRRARFRGTIALSLVTAVFPCVEPLMSVAVTATLAPNFPAGHVREGEIGAGYLAGPPALAQNCGLTTRRWRQLAALLLGVSRTLASVFNALSEDAFDVEDAPDFVFASSAAMAPVGLAAMLLLSLCTPEGEGGEEEEQEGAGSGGGEGEERRGIVLEGFGSPLVILANGVRQIDRSLMKQGRLGVVCQAAVVCVIGLTLLQKVDARAFVIVFYALFVLLSGFCFVTNDWLPRCFGNAPVSLVDPECPAFSLTYVLVLSLLGVYIAEFVLLAFRGKSWNAALLAVLDVVGTSFVVFQFARSSLENDTRLENNPRACCCRLDSVFYVMFG